MRKPLLFLFKQDSLWPVLCIIFSLCIVSCNNGKKIRVYEAFRTECELTSDSVPLETAYDILYKTICGDYLVISSNHATQMLHFYSTPDITYQFSIGERGHPKDEFETYPTFCNSFSEDLYVRGYSVNTIRRLGLDKDSVFVKDEYKLKITGVPNQMHIINDSTLYYMDYSASTIQSYNLKSQKDVLLKSVGQKGESQTSLSINYGSFIGNPKTSMYVYQYKKELDVFDTKYLSYKYTIQWNYARQESMLSYENLDYVTLHYTGGWATERYIFVLYRGFKPTENNVCSHIEMYDSEGIPIAVFNLDKQIYSFVADEKNRMFYAFGENEDYIYKYYWGGIVDPTCQINNVRH